MYILYYLLGFLIMGCSLVGLAFFMLFLSKRETSPYYLLIVLPLGVFFLVSVGYMWIQSMIDIYHPSYDDLLMKMLGIVEGYETHFWFSVFSIDVNYTIVKATITSYALIGGTLGVMRTIYGLFKK